jgi:hypothetical protein
MAVTDRSAAGCRVFVYLKFSQTTGAGRDAEDEWSLLRCLPDQFASPEGLLIRRCAQDEPGRPPSIVVVDCGSNSLLEYYVQKGETGATDVSDHAAVTTLVGERMGCGTLRPRGVASLRDALLVHLDKVRGTVFYRSCHTCPCSPTFPGRPSAFSPWGWLVPTHAHRTTHPTLSHP